MVIDLFIRFPEKLTVTNGVSFRICQNKKKEEEEAKQFDARNLISFTNIYTDFLQHFHFIIENLISAEYRLHRPRPQVHYAASLIRYFMNCVSERHRKTYEYKMDYT